MLVKTATPPAAAGPRGVAPPMPTLPKGYVWEPTKTNFGNPYAKAVRWKPEYEPSYWEDPVNVQRWYKEVQAGRTPEWLDAEKVSQAYEYMKFANQGAEDSGWRWLHPTDPGRGFLQTIDAPPMEVVLPQNQLDQIKIYDLATKSPEEWTEQDLLGLSPQYQQAFREQQQLALQAKPMSELPLWQQFVFRATQNPIVGGALTGISGGAVGFLGGPVAGLAGMATGGLLGAGLAALSTSEMTKTTPLGQLAQGALVGLNIPFETLERVYSLYLQYLSPDSPYVGEDLGRVMDELRAAWQAGPVVSETSAFTDPMTMEMVGSPQWGVGQLMTMLGYGSVVEAISRQEGRLDLLNVPAFLEWGIRKKLNEYGITSDPGELQLAKFNQAWQMEAVQVGEKTEYLARPVDVGYAGMAALTDARRRILAGENPVDVRNDIYVRFGASGQMMEMAAGLIFDPLNFLPSVGAISLGKAAEWTNHPYLAQAMRTSGSLGEGLGKYRAMVQTGLVGPANLLSLNPFQRLITGVNKAGQIGAWLPVDKSANLINNAVSAFFGYTNESKARGQIGMATENIGNMILHFGEDIDGLEQAFDTVATKRPSEAATIAATFGSPEMYTVQRVVAPFAEVVHQDAATWRANTVARDLLHTIAQAAQMTPAELVKMMGDLDDPGKVLNALQSTLKNIDSELAKSLLASNLDAKAIKPLIDLFAGKNPQPYTPKMWMAQLYGKFEDHLGKIVPQVFGLKPSHPMIRFTELMKKAQGVILLGLNPAYLFNNEFNNMVRRAGTGIFGYVTDRTISRYFEDFGQFPYRFEAGIGAADIMPEGHLLQPEEAGAIKVTGAGEIGIRRATHTPEGLVDRVLKSANKIGVMSTASRALESMESRQAFYFAHKKAWNSSWRRNVGFRIINDQELMRGLQSIDPGLPETVYRIIEGSKNSSQLVQNINKIVKGATREYMVSNVIPDVARQLGMDPVILKDTLSPVYDDLQDALSKARTPEDVHRAFRNITEKAQAHADRLTADQLKTRAQEIAAKTKADGWISALKLVNEMSYNAYDHILKHFREWQDVFDRAGEMEAAGASRSSIDALFHERQITASREWARQRAFQKASQKGILEAWGAGNEFVNRYNVLFDQQGQTWDTYFLDVLRKRDALIKRRNTFATNAEYMAAWNALEVELHEQFIDTSVGVNQIASQIDDIFTDVLSTQFGERAAIEADLWRNNLRAMEDARQMLMRQFREDYLKMTAAERRAAFNTFLNEEYMPMVYKYFVDQHNHFNTLYNNITGRTPPPSAPPPEGPEAPPQPVPPGPGPAPAAPTAGGLQPPPRIEPAPERAPMQPDEAASLARRQLADRIENVLEMARQAGLETVDRNGNPISLTGQHAHLMNIIKKYGDEIPRDLPHEWLMELPDETLQAIFNRWQQDKQARTNGLPVTPTEPEAPAPAPKLTFQQEVDRILKLSEEEQVAFLVNVSSDPRLVKTIRNVRDVLQKIDNFDWTHLPEDVQRAVVESLDWVKAEGTWKGQPRRYVAEELTGRGEGHLIRGVEGSEVYKDLKNLGWYGPDGKKRTGEFAIENAVNDILTGSVRKRNNLYNRIMKWAWTRLENTDAIRRVYGYDMDFSKEILIPHKLKQYLEGWGFMPETARLAIEDARVKLDNYLERLTQYYEGDIPEHMLEYYLDTSDALEKVIDDFGPLPEPLPEPMAPEPVPVETIQGIDDRITTEMDGYITRANVREYIVDEYLKHTENQLPGMSLDDSAEAMMLLLDAHAKVWAEIQNSTPELWYSTHLAGVKSGVDPDVDLNFRGMPQDVRGAVEFLNDGRALLYALKSPDVSTFVHEIGHVFRRDLPEADLRLAEEYAGASEGVWTPEAEDRFAYGFEQYLAEGKAPTSALQRVFDSFSKWILGIYRALIGDENIGMVLPELNDEIRGVYGRLLELHPEAIEPEVARAPSPDVPQIPGFIDVIGEWQYFDFEGDIYRANIDSPIEPGTGLPQGSRFWSTRNDTALKMLDEFRRQDILSRGGTVTDLTQQMDMFPGGEDLPLMTGTPMRGELEVPAETGIVTPPLLPGMEEVYRPQMKGAKEGGTAEGAGPLFQQGVTPPAVGKTPPGMADSFGTPTFSGQHEGDAWQSRVQPILDAVHSEVIRNPVTGRDIPENVRGRLDAYARQVAGDMATNHMYSMRWAEQQRDFALLNYSRRRGFDTALGLVFPYQFWYTRSLFNWAQLFFDQPAWFSQWARLRSMQERTKRRGFPQRLSNRFTIPAPYLPEWAGDNVYVDPIRKSFPFEEFLSPFVQMMREKGDKERSAEWQLQAWINDGTINQQEAYQAATTRQGDLWLRAVTASQADQSDTGDGNYINMIMQPALYLTLPAFLMTGKNPMTGREDLPLLPITRTGLGLEAATKETPLEFLGDTIGGLLAGPERLLRRKAGLSEFGDWGDWYIDRMLANMAAEGYGVSEVEQAMIEHSGEVYEEAAKRVRYEIGIGVPGAAVTQATLKGQAWNNPSDYMTALLYGWLPAGILPEGELRQRGLGEIYKNAREAYNQGDTEAFNKFLDKYPEYEARLALYDEPDVRLRKFLINEVWDQYTSLGNLHKQQVRDNFGEDFTRYFLDNETRDYETIDTETLAVWARMMSGNVPRTTDTSLVLDAPDIDIEALNLAPPGDAAVVDTYRNMRNQLFPNWYAMQSWYFSFPKGSDERRQILKQFPQLKDYWDWSRSYKEAYPQIEQYTTQGGEAVAMDYSWMTDLSDFTIRQLYAYYAMQKPLTEGVLLELQQAWRSQGSPGDFTTWIDNYVKQGIMP